MNAPGKLHACRAFACTFPKRIATSSDLPEYLDRRTILQVLAQAKTLCKPAVKCMELADLARSPCSGKH